LSRSLVVFVQYGAPPGGAQSVAPWEHDESHIPFMHTCPGEHAVPQAPQLLGSTFVSAHELPHRVEPLPQAEDPHLPARQYPPAGQALPHPPQFCGSVWVSLHVVPHFVVVPPQVAAHAPA
jgi:hypothetical protein